MQGFDHGPSVEAFLRIFARALAGGPPATSWGAGCAETLAERAAGVRPTKAVEPATIPVAESCRHALVAEPTELSRSVAALLPRLHLTRSKAYLQQLDDPSFGECYGYGVICGPESGPPPLMPSGDVALGILLLGPQTHYPLHHHPAEELYHVVGGTALWRKGDEQWTPRPPGSTIHHLSWQPHATMTQGEPLVAVYIWRGEIGTDAAFLPAVEGA